MYSHEDATQPRDRRAWTDDEDELLRRAIDKEDGDANPPSKWHAIAKHIPNRTNKDCRKRWWAQMATRVSKGSWSAEEDERLFSAVDELGTKWAAVASRVGTRNSGQCAKRWNDALNPAIDRSGWTHEEDQQLLKAVESQGHCWANIARTYLPGRTGLAAKNRYNHLIRGSSDRSPSSRGRRMSAAAAMRRRSTRGSSISSMSSPPSPRSTATPPPSSSGASSPGSAGSPPTPDGYALHSPLDFAHHAHKWAPTHDPLFSDSPLAHGAAHLENDMLNMFMQNPFSEFLDPTLDPNALGPLSPHAFPTLQDGQLVTATGEPWELPPFPSYLEFSPNAGHLEQPPQLTPSMSSSGESSVNSTPQLGHPHFGGMGLAPRFVQDSQVGYFPDRGAQQYLSAGIDMHDQRLAAMALCDPFGHSNQSMHGGLPHLGSLMANHNGGAQ